MRLVDEQLREKKRKQAKGEAKEGNEMQAEMDATATSIIRGEAASSS